MPRAAATFTAAMFALTALASACTDRRSVSVAAAQDRAAELVKFRYESIDLPSRDYYLAIPQSAPLLAPLVVYLHGCMQTAPDAALGTRWAERAQQQGFYALFPEQYNPNDGEPGLQQVQDHLLDGNGARCWNWYRPEHLQRDAGEPATIAQIIRQTLEQYPIDRSRVYLAGVSAGGVMASTLGATYPELFAALGIVAGCGYPACADPSGAFAAQAMAGRVTRMPLMIVHGSADEAAPVALGVDALLQWLGTNDLLDDGQSNQSVPRLPATTDNRPGSGLFGTAPAPGDLCLSAGPSPCLGLALGIESQYPHTVQHYVDAAGRPLIDFWIVHGLSHNYPGGNPEGTFVDPLGPDVTDAMLDFFQSQAPVLH